MSAIATPRATGHPLSEVQVAAYRRDGFLVVPGLLTAEEADAFLADNAGPPPAGLDLGLRTHVARRSWARLATHPAIVGRCEALLGAPSRIVQTMFLDKPAGGKGIALHQDEHYLPVDAPTLMACWLALTDTDAGNGGLCVVPGSHLAGVRTAGANHDSQEHERWEQVYDYRDRAGRGWKETIAAFAMPDVRPEEVVRLAVPKGAGVFFTGRTIHGSYANHAPDRPRRSFATHYVAEGTWVTRCDVQATVAPGDLRRHGAAA
jgi:ectoine hydroxylase-related dioxygenase (phytanoyl-CoA dioxygenase family)